MELAAETRLRGSSYPQLYRIRCDFQAGVLTLRGRVTSYYLKQIAQNLVDRLENGVEVDNQLDVVTPSIPRQRKPW